MSGPWYPPPEDDEESPPGGLFDRLRSVLDSGTYVPNLSTGGSPITNPPHPGRPTAFPETQPSPLGHALFGSLPGEELLNRANENLPPPPEPGSAADVLGTEGEIATQGIPGYIRGVYNFGAAPLQMGRAALEAAFENPTPEEAANPLLRASRVARLGPAAMPGGELAMRPGAGPSPEDVIGEQVRGILGMPGQLAEQLRGNTEQVGEALGGLSAMGAGLGEGISGRVLREPKLPPHVAAEGEGQAGHVMDVAGAAGRAAGQTHADFHGAIQAAHEATVRETTPPPEPPPPPKANAEIRKVANDYAASAGIAEPAPHVPATPNNALLTDVANHYEQSPSMPEDADVQRAYGAFRDETHQQFKALQDAGYKFEPWKDEGQPYHNSTEMRRDVADNKHLYVFEGGEPHPVLTDRENYEFRAVHDALTHAKEGFQFGRYGEYNTFLEHSKLYTPEAQRALATETLAQNAWVNYGPFGEANRANPAKTVYAQQKALVLPQDYIDRALADRGPLPEKAAPPAPPAEVDRARVAAETAVPRDAVGNYNGPNPTPAPQRPVDYTATTKEHPAPEKAHEVLGTDDEAKQAYAEATAQAGKRLSLATGQSYSPAEVRAIAWAHGPEAQGALAATEEGFGPLESAGRGTYENVGQVAGEGNRANGEPGTERAVQPAGGTEAEIARAPTQTDRAFREDAKRYTTEGSPLRTQRYGIISASDAGSVRATESSNTTATLKLQRELEGLGYNPVSVTGRYVDRDTGATLESQSFLVAGLRDEHMAPLLRKYAQTAGITHEGYVYPDGTYLPTREVIVGDHLTHEYTEMIVNDKPVRFTFAFDGTGKADAVPQPRVWSLVENEGRWVVDGSERLGEPTPKGTRYSAKLALYDSATDPQGLGARAQRMALDLQQPFPETFAAEVKRAGWDGYVGPTGQVHPFADIKPGPALDLSGVNKSVQKSASAFLAGRLASVGLPVAFYAAAEQTDDPHTKSILRGLGDVAMVAALGAVIGPELPESFHRFIEEQKEQFRAGNVPKTQSYGSRDWWESKVGKLDDVTWGKILTQYEEAWSQKLDPMGRAYVEGEVKQYEGRASYLLDPDGQAFKDNRVKFWESQGVRREVIGDKAQREMAGLLGVKAEEISKSAVKALTAPELFALNDLKKLTKDTIEQIGRKLANTQLSDAERSELGQRMNEALARFDQAGVKFFEVRTELGRAMRALRMIGSDLTEPGFWQNEAAKKLGVNLADLPPSVRDDISTIVRTGKRPPSPAKATDSIEETAKAQEKDVAQQRATEISSLEQEAKGLGLTGAKRATIFKKVSLASETLRADLKTAADAARQRITDRHAGRLMSGVLPFDPEDIPDAIIIGAHHLVETGYKFGAFLAKLNSEFPNTDVENYAPRIYRASMDAYKGRLARDTSDLEPRPLAAPRIAQKSLGVPPIEAPTELLLPAAGQAVDETASLRGRGRPLTGRDYENYQTGTEPKQGPETQKAAFSKMTPERQAALVDYIKGLGSGSAWSAPLRPFHLIGDLKEATKLGWTPKAQDVMNAWQGGMQIIRSGLLYGGALIKKPVADVAVGLVESLGVDPAAAVIDRVVALARGTYDAATSDKSFGEAYRSHITSDFGFHMWKGQGQGAVVGTRKAWFMAKTGYDPDHLLTSLMDQHYQFKSPVLRAFTEGSYRFLGGVTQFFKQIAFSRSLAERAGIKAIREGLNPGSKEWGARVGEIVRDPANEKNLGETGVFLAGNDANWATFTNPTTLSRVMRGLVNNFKASSLPGSSKFDPEGSALSAITHIPFLEPSLLFTKVPPSAAMKLIDYSPLGVVTATLNGLKPEALGGGQRAFVKGLARAGVGSGVFFYLGYLLREANQAQGYQPRTTRERALNENLNIPPNSVNIYGQNRSLGFTGPGAEMAQGANYYDILKAHPDESWGMGMARLTPAIFRSALDESSLMGTNVALDFINDPEKNFNRFAGGFAKELIPTPVKALRKKLDPFVRETDDVGSQVLDALPGASQYLPKAQTSVGFEKRHEGFPADPSLPRTTNTDPIAQELQRLDYSPVRPGKGGKFGDADRKRTPEEYQLYSKMVGERMRLKLYDLLQNPDYIQANDNEKVGQIRDLERDVREEAKDDESNDSYDATETTEYKPLKKAFHAELERRK